MQPSVASAVSQSYTVIRTRTDKLSASSLRGSAFKKGRNALRAKRPAASRGSTLSRRLSTTCVVTKPPSVENRSGDEDPDDEIKTEAPVGESNLTTHLDDLLSTETEETKPAVVWRQPISAEQSKKQQLPFGAIYDIDAITEYFKKKPTTVITRAGRVAYDFARIAWVWILDEKLKRKPIGQGIESRRSQVLRDIVSDMGPVFVKVAQTLSTRPDLIGDEAAEALEVLQDKMPVFDSKAAYSTISEEMEWSGPISPTDVYTSDCSEPEQFLNDPACETLFRSLSETPVSAASLGQVYRGVTHEGTEVAVKVQRPGMLEIVSRDLWILRTFFAWWEVAFDSNTLTPEIADEVGEGLFAELDYLREAANMREFSAAHRFMDFVRVPDSIPKYSTPRVLTTEWVHGRSLQALSPAEQIHMAKMGVESSCAQLLLTGVLHADPHEGNMLYGLDNNLYFLDFGLISHMDQGHQEGMAMCILHLLSGQWDMLFDDFERMGVIQEPYMEWEYKPKKGEKQGWRVISADALRNAFVTSLQNAASGNDNYVSEKQGFGDLFADLTAMAYNYRFTVPPYYVLIMRSFVTLEGVAKRADPDFNIYEASLPYAVYRILSPRTPDGEQALREVFLDSDNNLRVAHLENMLEEAAAGARNTASADDKHKNASAAASSGDRSQQPEAGTAAAALGQPEEDSVEKIVGVVKEVLVRREGRYLRRILWDTNTVTIAAFLVSKRALAMITAAVESMAEKLRTGSGESTAPSSSSGSKIMVTSGGENAGEWRQGRVIGALARHHARRLLFGGFRGWWAMMRLAAAAAVIGAKLLPVMVWRWLVSKFSGSKKPIDAEDADSSGNQAGSQPAAGFA